MAPSSDLSGSSAFDGLLKKRQTISAARAEEDAQRAEAQKKEDDELELAKKNATRPWEVERTNRLAQHEKESLFSVKTLEVKYAQELADLQKRQAVETSALKRCNNKKKATIEIEFTASYTNRVADAENQFKGALKTRERNEMDLKRKRDAEDGQLKKDVFSAFEAMALPTQNEKLQSSSSNISSSATENKDIGEAQQASKRQKVKHEAEVQIPASVAPAVEGSFRLRSIKSGKDFSEDFWHHEVLGSEKVFRYNAQEQLFCPYSGIECEAKSHPGWVLDVTRHLDIHYNGWKARNFRANDTLVLEFWNNVEYFRFFEFCRSQNLNIDFKISLYGSSGELNTVDFRAQLQRNRQT